MGILNAKIKCANTKMEISKMSKQLDKYIEEYCIDSVVKDLIENTNSKFSIRLSTDDIWNIEMMKKYNLDPDYIFCKFEYILQKIKDALEKYDYKCRISSCEFDTRDKCLIISWEEEISRS